MSAVRMCDACSRIFSENAEGWETYDATRRIRDKDGRQRTEHVTRDACPDCAFRPGQVSTFPAIQNDTDNPETKYDEVTKHQMGYGMQG